MPTKEIEMTPLEYAKHIGVTIGYVYLQLRMGALPARKVMGRWLIQVEQEER